MKPDSNLERRVAWLIGLLLGLGIVAMVYWGYDPEPQSKGIGFGLILEKQGELRRDLAREARHLNDLESWQIQEEVAARSGLSRAGVKELVQRARHARDPSVKIEALLLSGEIESATDQARQLAEALLKKDLKGASTAFRQAGDGYWRNVQPEEAAECYEKAGVEARMDLALLHWTQANFHPEDVHAELRSARRAVELAIQDLKADSAALDVAAAHRLLGNVILRQAEHPESPNGEKLRGAWMKEAEVAMRSAIGALDRGMHPELWAAIHHDLGVVMLVKSELEPFSMVPLQDAVLSFFQALEVRTGSLTDGDGKADALALRLSQRAETLAYLALAQAYLADSRSPSGESAVSTADLALGLSQPQDPGLAWFMAHFAKLRTLIKHPSQSSERGEPRFLELVTLFERTLKNYPAALAGYPGVPSLSKVVGLASEMCENCTQSLSREQLSDPSARLVALLKPYASDTKSVAHSAALKASGRCLALAIEGGFPAPLPIRVEIVPSNQLRGVEVFNETEKLPVSWWRMNQPPGRLWRGQMQRMQETLNRWSR